MFVIRNGGTIRKWRERLRKGDEIETISLARPHPNYFSSGGIYNNGVFSMHLRMHLKSVDQ